MLNNPEDSLSILLVHKLFVQVLTTRENCFLMYLVLMLPAVSLCLPLECHCVKNRISSKKNKNPSLAR